MQDLWVLARGVRVRKLVIDIRLLLFSWCDHGLFATQKVRAVSKSFLCRLIRISFSCRWPCRVLKRYNVQRGTQYGVQDTKLCEMLIVQHCGKSREVKCPCITVISFL